MNTITITQRTITIQKKYPRKKKKARKKAMQFKWSEEPLDETYILLGCP